jgi:hypothetical protein
VEWDWVHLARRPAIGSIAPAPGYDELSVQQSVEWEVVGEPKYLEKICPSGTL